MRYVGWLAGTLAILALAACSPKVPPNVFLIVVDALRADRVGWYGDQRGLTPFLDSLAEGGTVFWNAYAQSSWTSPSVATIFTSRYASEHNVIHMVKPSVLGPEEQTLAQSFKQHGYLTAGFSGNIIVSAALGFANGFDQFFLVRPGGFTAILVKGRAEELDSACLAWVAQARERHPGTPMFVYLHYMETHTPFNPPPALLDRLVRARPHPEERPQWITRAREQAKSVLFGGLELLDTDALSGLQDLYDAEVTSLDLQLTDLFSRLRKQGLLANAVVVITADHGEEFREHGHVGHGSSLYNELTHVPLLLLTPNSHSRADIRDVVSHVDIAPTLLDYAGIAAPPTFEGRSLRGLVRRHNGFWRLVTHLQELFAAPRRSEQASYSELFPLDADKPEEPDRHHHAVIVGDRKLIVHADGKEESFDLATNPHESPAVPLAESEVSALRATLDRFSTQLAHKRSPEQTRPLDAETRERMRALGYLK
jgi:arylsulfatase A-like enzyme